MRGLFSFVLMLALFPLSSFSWQSDDELECIENSISMKLRLIPAGSYRAAPKYTSGHNVRITHPFYIGVNEVTQAQYAKVMGENPSRYVGENLPVDSVSWFAARSFCEKLSAIEGVVYRLPTEAEWEYAARAGIRTRHYWGDEVEGAYAWYRSNSDLRPHPVGLKKPNQWGLYDMIGNAWEWCADWYSVEYFANPPVDDPAGPESGTHRVLRGASWQEPADNLNLIQRGMSEPGAQDFTIGFRVVREIGSDTDKSKSKGTC